MNRHPSVMPAAASNQYRAQHMAACDKVTGGDCEGNSGEKTPAAIDRLTRR